MRNFESDKPTPTPEQIVLKPGVGVYPISERVIGDVRREHADDDEVEAELLQIAALVQAARIVIERQGGTYNGFAERTVIRRDQEWMGAITPISVLYVLAYLPTE